MSLAVALARTKTEEDVKDAYIKALGLESYFKGLVDIRTDKVWFEAKYVPTSPLVMFGQLLVYVRAARGRGEPIPPFLVAIDRRLGAILPIAEVLSVFDDESIVWPSAGSKADEALALQIAPYLDGHFTTYPIGTMESEFIASIKAAIRDGKVIKTPITPDNLRQAFDKWVEMIGNELDVANQSDLATLFFADVMHDGVQSAYASVGARLGMFDGQPAFILQGASGYVPVMNVRAYDNFWSIYLRPPEQRHRQWIIERRDSLLPLNDQKFKGAFYTPFHVVDKAYDQLLATLGEGWQERYIVWDMCAGVGNLEAKHNHLRNVYMSTLDEPDVLFMKSKPTFAGATIFQYDFLNDDVTDFGEIDYTRSNKVPMALRQAIADAKAGVEGAKPILVLINPPYAESGSGIAKGDENKIGVEKTRINGWMREMNVGYASKELFAQFLVRIRQELPNAKLAMFSTLKYINAPNFEPFRRVWQARYLDGFVVHSRAFDGLKGAFPIGFLIWDQSLPEPVRDIEVIALARSGEAISQKQFVVRPTDTFLNAWIEAPPARGEFTIPLANALTPSGNPRMKRSCAGSVGYLFAGNNDLQNASTGTCLTSSIYTGRNGGGTWLNDRNLSQAAILFSVRRLIKPTWLNDRDQFLQPSERLTDDFKSDCLVWMLFNGSNLTAGADGLRWNDRDWSLVNHFVPFTEAEVGAKGRFESDFMVRYMAGMAFSPEAQAVLDEGRKLWTRFHATQFPRKIRDEYKLGRPDAGWYQIRRALEAYGDTELTDFDPFKAAYTALSAKLRPMVYGLGFLPA
ncbi:MAG: hypothetical protein K2X00_21905 [Nitrospiraceae bacterium]|nr:hypothetical protein [Nitrospiraceae bacterium]OQW76725.1 MAG: hypothetical protein BVN33_05020 [Proteobacteria bacterium ST_bin13]